MRFTISYQRLILVLCAISSVASAQRTILGVLEEHPGIHYGDPPYRAVRVVFQKNGNEWQAFRSDCPDQDCGNTFAPDYPGEIRWTIAFDGKNLGAIASKAAENRAQYSDGLQQIVSSGDVPTVGKRTEEFMDAAVYRPLVANSQPFFNDPELWKPFTPQRSVIVALRQNFRKQFPMLCRMSKSDQTKLEPFRYGEDEVALVKAYSSKLGRIVARMHLQAIDCNDTEAGFDLDDPWYAVELNGSVSYLGSGLRLVDAGDYDNNGSSELIFAITREDRGGYELFYDDFKKHATFEFAYH